MQRVDMQPGTLFTLGVGLFLFYQFLTRKKRDRYLPPGPKGYPIIGVSSLKWLLHRVNGYNFIECRRRSYKTEVVEIR